MYLIKNAFFIHFIELYFIKKKCSLDFEARKNYIWCMALAISTVPVLTDDVANDFVRRSDFNSEHLAGSEYSAEKEVWCLKILENSKIDQEKRASGK